MVLGVLSFEEKQCLLAVEKGDVASQVGGIFFFKLLLFSTLYGGRMLENKKNAINIDCVDPLGRTALLMAIDNENLEMVELLLENKVPFLFIFKIFTTLLI